MSSPACAPLGFGGVTPGCFAEGGVESGVRWVAVGIGVLGTLGAFVSVALEGGSGIDAEGAGKDGIVNVDGGGGESSIWRVGGNFSSSALDAAAADIDAWRTAKNASALTTATTAAIPPSTRPRAPRFFVGGASCVSPQATDVPPVTATRCALESRAGASLGERSVAPP